MKKPKPSQPKPRLSQQPSSPGTILDRIVMPAMSGEEALRRFGGTLHSDKKPHHEPSQGKASPMTSVTGTAENGGPASARAHGVNGQDDQGPSVRHSSTDAVTQSSSTLSSYDREDLAALAQLPFAIRVVSVVGTLALLVGVILLSLFIVNWLNAP